MIATLWLTQSFHLALESPNNPDKKDYPQITDRYLLASGPLQTLSTLVFPVSIVQLDSSPDLFSYTIAPTVEVSCNKLDL